MKMLGKFSKLSRRQKIECIIASSLTAVFLVSLPAYAWFAKNRSLETITKIKEPGEIILRAGKAIKPNEADPIVNFEMKDINIETIASGKPQRFVFSVMPGDTSHGYYIQLAHTTNIPFTYTLYHAAAKTDAEVDDMSEEQKADIVVYRPVYAESTVHTNYAKNGGITLTPLNEDNGITYGRKVAKAKGTDDNNCYSRTYDEASVLEDDTTIPADDPEIYAVPIYLQTNMLSHDREGDGYDYYILELGWDGENYNSNSVYADWNNAKNNKETDMIYITAKQANN